MVKSLLYTYITTIYQQIQEVNPINDIQILMAKYGNNYQMLSCYCQVMEKKHEIYITALPKIFYTLTIKHHSQS